MAMDFNACSHASLNQTCQIVGMQVFLGAMERFSDVYGNITGSGLYATLRRILNLQSREHMEPSLLCAEWDAAWTTLAQCSGTEFVER